MELPWGLSWDDLRVALPKLRRPVGADRTHKINGLRRAGRSELLTIRYEDQDGHRQDQVIFVKLTDPQRPEAPKYRHLAALGAPVPPLLGTATTAAGEVIVLEYLPTIGTSPDETDDLLGLIADLNSLSRLPAELFRPPKGTPGHEARVRQALATLLPTETAADEWLDAYRRAAVAAGRMPLALNHNGLGLQQVGWVAAGRDRPRRLVVFDLETMSLRPRYTDLATVLPWLADRTGRTEWELFDTYLTFLDQRTGATTDRRLAWRDVRTLGLVRTFEALPWLITMTGTPGVEAPDRAIARLGRDLADQHR